MKIAVIDDHLSYAQTLSQFLSNQEFINKTEAYPSIKSFTEFKDGNYDLIILDYFIPDESSLKFIQDNKNLNILVMSGNLDKDIIDITTKYGAKGFIYKEMSINEILDVINNFQNN